MDETSNQPATADELASVYLCGRDVPCPGCGYNRRDGVGAACPECGAMVRVRSSDRDEHRVIRGVLWLVILVGVKQIYESVMLISDVLAMARDRAAESLIDDGIEKSVLSATVDFLSSLSSLYVIKEAVLFVAAPTILIMAARSLWLVRRDRWRGAAISRLPLVTIWAAAATSCVNLVYMIVWRLG